MVTKFSWRTWAGLVGLALGSLVASQYLPSEHIPCLAEIQELRAAVGRTQETVGQLSSAQNGIVADAQTLALRVQKLESNKEAQQMAGRALRQVGELNRKIDAMAQTTRNVDQGVKTLQQDTAVILDKAPPPRPPRWQFWR